MAAFDGALRTLCKPGSRIVDLGCGPGLLSLLACRYGAARVYALEPTDIIALAQQIAAVNGVSDRITFIQQMSTAVTLPEPVDVVVADVRGVLPMTGTSLATMRDARRFLRPGGHMVPASDRVRVALIEAPVTFGQLVEPWRECAHGFDLRAAEHMQLHTWRRVNFAADAMLTDPCTLFEIDYATNEAVSVGGTAEVTIVRAGVTHALCAWFDTTCYGEFGFSNAPGMPATIYGQAFFPLNSPVDLSEGDRATLTLRAQQVEGDYVWLWAITIRDRTGRTKSDERHSTFHGAPVSLQTLRGDHEGTAAP